ncbi:cell division topological specificity factor MinE [Desulfothermobacter acidiphilus]|uniref:cell division topological specificity factor MinE n=1 Tax=Desulfothermobacter acidiphilus TaxID=1938353 RepID=UPI003F8C8067
MDIWQIIGRWFNRPEVRSKEVARERLRLILVHDRANVSPELLEHLKQDLLAVISRYMEVEEQGLEVALDSSEEMVALVASIPIRRVKRSAKVAPV